MDRQVAFLDNGIRPNGLHDLALGHELTGPFQKEEENVSRSQPQRDRRFRAVLGDAQQFARQQFESELVENQRPRHHEHLPAPIEQTSNASAIEVPN
jgi:hypothetical protein